MVYTWYMKCICRPDRYVRYKPSKYLMGLFRTFFYNDIHLIYYVYPKDIHSIMISQYAFKNVRNMETFLEENAHAPDGTQPILARETMA